MHGGEDERQRDRPTKLAGSVPLRAMAAPGAMMPIESAIASQKRSSRRKPRSWLASASVCSPVTSSSKDVVGEKSPDYPVGSVHNLVDAQIHGDTTQGVRLLPGEVVAVCEVLHCRAHHLLGRLHQVARP